MDALFFTWVFLLLLTLFIYLAIKKDLSNPVFLLSVSFFLSFSVVIYNIKNWDIAIHGYYWETTQCIAASILSFALGYYLISRVTKTTSLNSLNVSFEIADRNMNYPYAIFSIISVIMFLLFVSINIGTINVGSLSSFQDSLNENYSAGKDYNFFTTQILELLVALAYINLHRIAVEKYYLKRRINPLLFVPILLFLLGALLYTDRNIFLRFMIFFLVTFVMSINWGGISVKKNKKLIIRLSLFIVVIAIVFWVYGYLKEYTSNFERMVGIYAGSGLYGFNLWLHDFDGNYSMGKYSFSAIMRTLETFGIGPGSDVSQNWEYIVYLSKNNYVFATNIYSALRPYYQDFGLTGIIVISLLMGSIFAILYKMAIRRKYGFWWLFYCAHIYHIIYMPIAEQFLIRLHLGLVYEIFWLVVLYYFVYGNKGYWKYRFVFKRIRK